MTYLRLRKSVKKDELANFITKLRELGSGQTWIERGDTTQFFDPWIKPLIQKKLTEWFGPPVHVEDGFASWWNPNLKVHHRMQWNENNCNVMTTYMDQETKRGERDPKFATNRGG